MKKRITIISALFLVFLTGFSTLPESDEVKIETITTTSDTLEKVKAEEVVAVAAKKEDKLTLYKSDAMATYYADKFNGRKTTSGQRFHNNKYTAAHMKLPFGTKLRVTNESNGKSVDVTVNDRGPFSKKLEIDLTKKAFMDIASKKGSGSFKVKIEIIEE